MTKISGIYQITNMVSGKVYVGSAVNISDRWYRHQLHLRRGTHNCKPLQNSWLKYGEAAFTFAILEKVEDPALLMVREQAHLDLIRPFDNVIGYNCCSLAFSTFGIKYTDATKAKIAASTKGAHERGCYEKKNEAQRGEARSEEHKAKISASTQALLASGFKHSAERNAKIAASRTGKKYPALSASLKASAAKRKALAELTLV